MTTAGARSFAAFWIGGASGYPASAVRGGYRSMMALWIGGANSESAIPPVVTAGGHFIPTREELRRAKERDRKAERARQQEWAERLTDLRQLRSNLNRMFGLPEPEPSVEATEETYLAELSELNSEIGKQRSAPPGITAEEKIRRAALLDHARNLISELAAQAVRDRDEDDIEMILISL